MKALLAVIALVLTGCASQSQFGTYAEIAPGYRDLIAIDAANQFAAIYPPASTSLLMAIEPDDEFGRAFVSRLRLLGFSVQEAPSDVVPAQALRVGYVLDSLSSNAYRLLISAGSSSLSRAYLKVGNTFTPGGLWARREG